MNSKKVVKNSKVTKVVNSVNSGSVSGKPIYREGYIAAIAQATGYSQSHVTNVLAGRRNNAVITKTAKKFVKRVR